MMITASTFARPNNDLAPIFEVHWRDAWFTVIGHLLVNLSGRAQKWDMLAGEFPERIKGELPR